MCYLWVGADKGSVLNSGKTEAGGEVDVAVVGEDHLQDGDKEAEDWDREEVDVPGPGVWTTRAEVY